MTSYDIYVFLLCLIVYIMLVTLSVICLTVITRQQLKLIRVGAEDESILKEHQKNKGKKISGCFSKIAEYILSIIVTLFFIVALIISLLIRISDSPVCNALPTYRVVQSGSMAKINAQNTYVRENGLTDQIQTFDLIRTEPIPSENDLELYDIVVYRHDDILVIHRIVGIEEPNGNHPDCRLFTLQGDAVESPDRLPVYYSQMCGIYRGERIPNIGSFIMFMQSPAGWLCTILIIVAMIATPILDKKLQKAKDERIRISENTDSDNTDDGGFSGDNTAKSEEKEPVTVGGKDD